jgi:hypothetical protein
MMKSTSPLKPLCSARLPSNRLVIHPNEGADMGMMMTSHSARTGDGVEIEVRLLNECPRESVELSTGLWEQLGKPKQLVLAYDGGTIRIDPI